MRVTPPPSPMVARRSRRAWPLPAARGRWASGSTWSSGRVARTIPAPSRARCAAPHPARLASRSRPVAIPQPPAAPPLPRRCPSAAAGRCPAAASRLPLGRCLASSAVPCRPNPTAALHPTRACGPGVARQDIAGAEAVEAYTKRQAAAVEKMKRRSATAPPSLEQVKTEAPLKFKNGRELRDYQRDGVRWLRYNYAQVRRPSTSAVARRQILRPPVRACSQPTRLPLTTRAQHHLHPRSRRRAARSSWAMRWASGRPRSRASHSIASPPSTA